jgi:hypothetical protein
MYFLGSAHKNMWLLMLICQSNSNNETDIDYMIIAMGLLLNLCDQHVDFKEHGQGVCRILVNVSDLISLRL